MNVISYRNSIMYSNGPGHPCEYNAKDHAKIVEQFRHTIVLSNVAGVVERDKDTIKRWLAKGKADIDAGVCSEIAQFYIDTKKALAENIRKLEERLLNGEVNGWQRIAWYLERCARQDYGHDAGVIEDILEEFKEIKKQLGKENG